MFVCQWPQVSFYYYNITLYEITLYHFTLYDITMYDMMTYILLKQIIYIDSEVCAGLAPKLNHEQF